MGEGAPKREYMTVTQAAEWIGVSTMTIARWYDSGRLNGWRTAAGTRRIWKDATARRVKREHAAKLAEENP